MGLSIRPMSRRAHQVVAVAVIGLTALMIAGPVVWLRGGFWHGSGSDEEATYSCSRDMRIRDWKAHPLKTGQSIARCGWAEGWSQQRMRRVLGRPYGGSLRKGVRYVLDESRESLGPSLWILTLRFDPEHRRIVDASTKTEPY